MEISSLERKIITMIEEVQKSIAQLPSHHDLNIIEVDSSKKMREFSSFVDQI